MSVVYRTKELAPISIPVLWFNISTIIMCNFHFSKGCHPGDIGPKWGFNGATNGYLRLDHVRIPRDQMLSKYLEVSTIWGGQRGRGADGRGWVTVSHSQIITVCRLWASWVLSSLTCLPSTHALPFPNVLSIKAFVFLLPKKQSTDILYLLCVLLGVMIFCYHVVIFTTTLCNIW